MINQVRYLCQKIWEVEWSGVLFYSTNGEFGDEGFEITLEHIFPMNKGSQTYTEFETNEDYIEFLMDNPEFLTYKRGLIHSHNNMSVFFSGTDNSEIMDNSEFYNYYLSIIVNNKENVCGKIAFRGKTNETTVRNITFRGNNGEEKSQILEEKQEKEVVFIHNCTILKETATLVDGSYSKRVDEIIQQAAKKEAERATIAPKELGKQGEFDWCGL